VLALQVPPEDVAHIELPAPPISLWQKCIPLAIVFFCASFNLVRLLSPSALHCQILADRMLTLRQSRVWFYMHLESAARRDARLAADWRGPVCRRFCRT